ncbi:hypothetical protein JCM17380_23890 [Desulfosporosinus burensis]
MGNIGKQIKSYFLSITIFIDNIGVLYYPVFRNYKLRSTTLYYSTALIGMVIIIDIVH